MSRLGLFTLGLNCGEPIVTLGFGRCLESVLLPIDLEMENVESLFDKLGYLALDEHVQQLL